MNGLQNLFSKHDDVHSLITGIDEGLKEQLISGLSGSSRSMLIASVYEKTGQSILIVTPNLLQAQKLQEDLANFISDEELFVYPANELIAAELSVASPELRSQRVEVLNHWSKSNKGIVIVPIPGLRKLLPPKEVWKNYQFSFKLGEDLDLETAIRTFISMGYSRVEMVSSPGEFSIRGGIIDIYPITSANPIRIELFDTEIDSIRTFSIEDQRSISKLTSIEIGPVVEALLDSGHISSVVEKLENGLSKSLKKLKNEKVKELLMSNVSSELDLLKNGIKPDRIFKYLSLAYDVPASLIDYLPKNGIVIMDEIGRIQEVNDILEKEEADWYTGLLAEGQIIHDVQLAHRLPELTSYSGHPFIYLSLFLRHVPYTNPQNIINFTSKQMQSFHGQMNVFKTEVDRWKKVNMRCWSLDLMKNELKSFKVYSRIMKSKLLFLRKQVKFSLERFKLSKGI